MLKSEELVLVRNGSMQGSSPENDPKGESAGAGAECSGGPGDAQTGWKPVSSIAA